MENNKNLIRVDDNIVKITSTICITVISTAFIIGFRKLCSKAMDNAI